MNRMTMNLFLDMDGVFADLETHFQNSFGVHPRDTDGGKQFWKLVYGDPRFFANISPFEGAKDFYEEFEYLKPVFLTACPKTNYQSVALQKREWIRRHICNRAVVLPVMGGENKALFMHRQGDILVDDYQKNLTPWTALGGRAILHTDFGSTRSQLVDILKDYHSA